MAATFGVVPGLLYILLFIRVIGRQSDVFLGRIWILLILCAMFCTENLICSLFFWCVLFYESRYKVKTCNSYV